MARMPPPTGPGRTQANIVHRIGDRAIAGQTPACRISNPMVRLAIDGGDSTVANDKRPDIAAGVYPRTLERNRCDDCNRPGFACARGWLQRYRGLWDAREQSSPGAGYRL